MTAWPTIADAHCGDTALMLHAAAGDRASFDVVVERHRGLLVRFLYRKTRDYAAAEELAQDTFVRAYLARERYQPQARYRTWLYCIAITSPSTGPARTASACAT